MSGDRPSPRARYREQTRREIKEVALRQLAEGSGTAAVALTRIAKGVGLSGPALYRYFDSREALLTELIRDAYGELAATVKAAADALPPDASPRARLRRLATACPGWATARPHRYLLIEGTPVPGYTAHPDTLDSARAVLGPFLAAFAPGEPSAAVRPVAEEMRTRAGADPSVAGWARRYVPAGSEAVALAGAVLAWAALHGAIGLEAADQYSGMGHDGGTLLIAQLDTLADAFGLG